MKSTQMVKPRSLAQTVLASDLGVLVLFSLAWLALTCLTNGKYGFHRDELAFIDNGRFLDWGYVEYPPLSPFIARLSQALFGFSLVGLRFFSALAMSASIFLAGLMARELGGRRWAQLVAAGSVAIAPIVFANTILFTYSAFEYLCWALAGYFMIHLLRTDDPRWWLAVGAAIGLGMQAKYTMAYCAIGVAAGTLFTPARRYLKSPWLWGGAGLALLICLPNLVWQARHAFISLDFMFTIHARDIAIGRTNGFIIQQVLICVNIVTAPILAAGVWFYAAHPDGERYRPLAWMTLLPFALYILSQARFYYAAPIYPMLLAAGSVRVEGWLAKMEDGKRRRRRRLIQSSLIIAGVLVALLVLPLAPINSPWWNTAVSINGELREEVGWPEMAETVAGIRNALPEAERSQAGILAGNYGEAGAINLYGPAYGLPQSLSGIDTYWLRGTGAQPPQVFIVLGHTQAEAQRIFANCTLAGHTSNLNGVLNEETRDHPDIFVCREPRQPWAEFWKKYRHYG